MENTKVSFRHICKEDTYMFNYTQLPDELFTVELFKNLSLEAKVLYSFMLRRVSISKENSWIDEEGDVYIYYRTDEIMEKFNCSNKTASKIIGDLESIGLIEKVRQGQGKPDIIYVNKFSAVIEDQEAAPGEEPELPIENLEHLHRENAGSVVGENSQNPEVKKLHFQKCKNYTSRNEESTSLEVKKLHANYKDNNYNKSIISSSTQQQSLNHTEKVRLLDEEEKERVKQKVKYSEAERAYSAQIASAVLKELLLREQEYIDKVTAEMFLKTCKSIAFSKEPIMNLSGFIRWCFDHFEFIPTSKNNYKQSIGFTFNQFPQREYDYEEVEHEILSHT